MYICVLRPCAPAPLALRPGTLCPSHCCPSHWHPLALAQELPALGVDTTCPLHSCRHATLISGGSTLHSQHHMDKHDTDASALLLMTAPGPVVLPMLWNKSSALLAGRSLYYNSSSPSLQVYLGKWQETDVAVKVLLEMQHLAPTPEVLPQDPDTLQPWTDNSDATLPASDSSPNMTAQGLPGITNADGAADCLHPDAKNSEEATAAIRTLEREVGLHAASSTIMHAMWLHPCARCVTAPVRMKCDWLHRCA